MDVTEAGAVAIAALGAAIVLVTIAQIWRRRVNAKMADVIVVKIIHAGNLERLKKLAAGAPNTYLECYAEAIRAGETASSKDPVTIASLTHPAFEKRAAQLLSVWRSASLRGLAGAALGGAGLFLGYQHHYTPSHLRILGGLSALAGVWFLAHLGDLSRAVTGGREDVLPAIDRAFTGQPPAAALESDE
jgi:hypothetical protein